MPKNDNRLGRLPHGISRWTNPNRARARHIDDSFAHLIAAAVNACQSVNPDNPMAVAESIKFMYEALKEITELAPRDKLRLPYAIAAVEIADKALAKAEGREEK